MKIDKIERLIELKENEVEGLRVDLFRLNQLVDDMQVRLNNILLEKDNFVAQAARMERAKQYIFSDKLISYRAYITYLSQKVGDAVTVRDGVENQRDLARLALERAYVEMKSLEMVATRKSKLIEINRSHKLFQASDDEELLRIGRARQSNGER